MAQVKTPDFDEMMDLVVKIGELSHKKLVLDAKLDFLKSEILKKVTTEEIFFKGGKPAAYNFIESTYLTTGINNELVPIRLELADIISQLEQTKLRFDVLKMQAEVWRTESANARYASL